MSRATGYVWDSSGKLVGYAMYCGTSDVMWSRIYPTSEAAWGAYGRTRDDLDAWLEECHRDCSCGAEPVHGFIGTDYGKLHHWPATYCLACSAITSNRDFDEQWGDDGADYVPDVAGAGGTATLRSRWT